MESSELPTNFRREKVSFLVEYSTPKKVDASWEPASTKNKTYGECNDIETLGRIQLLILYTIWANVSVRDQNYFTCKPGRCEIGPTKKKGWRRTLSMPASRAHEAEHDACLIETRTRYLHVYNYGCGNGALYAIDYTVCFCTRPANRTSDTEQKTRYCLGHHGFIAMLPAAGGRAGANMSTLGTCNHETWSIQLWIQVLTERWIAATLHVVRGFVMLGLRARTMLIFWLIERITLSDDYRRS